MFKRIGKYIVLSVLVVFTICICALFGLYFSADMKEPNHFFNQTENTFFTDSLRVYKNSWLRLNSKGLWEMKVVGSDFDRGEAMGKLAEDLLYYQESVFINQIKTMIPSDSYLKFLRFFIVLFNRNLGENISEEYRNEIYGISQSCTHEYDAIGNPYERQLNYHAAHDLGHALQDYMMVGCTSFATWGKHSTDEKLTLGRNFDFYMGDDFARNRVVTFCSPDKGYKFVSIGWAGMIGVLSGMNTEGLTVTINAATSDVPTGSATPISILVREILQYASTIDEAFAIAKKRQTFVSEAILIGSKKDGKAAIIEKSPEKIDVFYSKDTQLICTNHFQSETFKTDERNIENIKHSDSGYRFNRMEELLNENQPIDPKNAANILRNQKGLNHVELGMTNEMAINQLLAHHSVIMQPEDLKIWVSTSPWQCGEYIQYDLNAIFNDSVDYKKDIHVISETIAADDFLESDEYKQLQVYKSVLSKLKDKIKTKEKMSIDSIELFIESNPNYYYVYKVVGDYYQNKDKEIAQKYWKKALTYPIPNSYERKSIENNLK